MHKYREERYETLIDVVYERRSWTRNGIPKLENIKEFGIDLPEVLEVVKKNL